MDTRTGEVMTQEEAVKKVSENPTENLGFIGTVNLPPTLKQVEEKKILDTDPCPCGRPLAYGECCKRMAQFGMNSQLVLVDGMLAMLNPLSNNSKLMYQRTQSKKHKYHHQAMFYVIKKLLELHENLIGMGAQIPTMTTSPVFKEGVEQADGSILHDEVEE